MNCRVQVSARAIGDLLGIRDWIAEQADVDTAEAFISRIRAKIDQLREFPKRGELFRGGRKGQRKLSFERSYIIFYRVEGALVNVDRVMSGRKDVSSIN